MQKTSRDYKSMQLLCHYEVIIIASSLDQCYIEDYLLTKYMYRIAIMQNVFETISKHGKKTFEKQLMT